MINKENLFSKSVISAYLLETENLVRFIKKSPLEFELILNYLKTTKNNSRLLGFLPVFKLFKALEDVYGALADGTISYTENLHNLIDEVADKINQCCSLIEKNDDSINFMDIHLYLLYCDKAVAKEIFDSKTLSHPLLEKPFLKDTFEKENKDEIVNVKSSKIEELLNIQEEMIARTYIIDNQLELLKKSVDSSDFRSFKELHKLLHNDCQSLQNSLRIVHENFRSLMSNNAFLKNHQEFQGFFVYANNEKYLIPSEFIFDVICANPKNYIINQNQKYVIYEKEDEGFSQVEKEEIPIYTLSSLLPGKMSKGTNILDTILLADYQSQRVGIIVESMQKFVSIIKKPMPSCFANFKILQGVAFDEKYDMIPILYLPEIMRRFRALRSYDVKKFEAYTKKHINKALIVDDSKTTRQIQNTILCGNGFLVDEAVDGIDAMEKIRKKQFDLIICDDVMPRMNGNIFLDNIRLMENYVNVPVVAISEEPLQKADAFVSKSDFERELLIQKIHEVMHE